MGMRWGLLVPVALALSGMTAPAPGHWVYKLEAGRPDLMATMTKEEGAAFAAHSKYLGELRAAGKLVLAGACKDGAFGVVILQAGSEAEARRLMEGDPIVQGKVLRADFHAFFPPMTAGQP